MFNGKRWAVVFINALGENAEEGLACLNALVPAIKSIPGALFGRSAAQGLEKILRESANTAVSGTAVAIEYAIRFIVLLVEKNMFRNIDSLLKKIEQRLDEQKGVLDVTAELAAPVDSVFHDKLERQIAERIGVANVKMKTKVVPELLGGYRLQIGGFYIDASLKGQLGRMASDLVAVEFTVSPDPKKGTAKPGGGM